MSYWCVQYGQCVSFYRSVSLVTSWNFDVVQLTPVLSVLKFARLAAFGYIVVSWDGSTVHNVGWRLLKRKSVCVGISERTRYATSGTHGVCLCRRDARHVNLCLACFGNRPMQTPVFLCDLKWGSYGSKDELVACNFGWDEKSVTPWRWKQQTTTKPAERLK
jgi:hypothetical protein